MVREVECASKTVREREEREREGCTSVSNRAKERTPSSLKAKTLLFNRNDVEHGESESRERSVSTGF